MQPRRLVSAVVVASLWFAAAASHAQPRASDSGYQDAIDRALQEYNLGHWTEAKVFFQQAHALKPSARTLRGIGLASYESRNYVEALEYLQQALASTVQPLTADMRASTTRLIALSRQFVMHAEVELEPADAELRVDGKTVQLGADGAVLLDPGEHEFTVLAPGYETLRRRVNSEGGRQTTLHLVLAPKHGVVPEAPLPAPPPAAAEMVPVEDSQAAEAGGSIAPWLVAGGGVALAAAGGVVLGLGLAAKADVEGVEDGASWRASESANDRSVPMQVAGGILLGVGLAAATAGLSWALWPAADSDQVAVRPSGLGVALTSKF